MMIGSICRRFSPGIQVFLERSASGLMLVAMVLVLSSAAPTTSHAARQGCVPGPHSGMIAASQEWCLKESPHFVTR